MNVDKQTVKIALISLVIALVWSLPLIRSLSPVPGETGSVDTAVVISVLIRTVIVFAVIRFILWIKDKNKK